MKHTLPIKQKKHLKTGGVLLVFILMSLSSYSQVQLLFSYDASGNQTVRKYCEGTCILGSKESQDAIAADLEDTQPIASNFDESVTMYPNPTSGILNLKWDTALRGKVTHIKLIDYQGRIIATNNVSDFTETVLDLSPYAQGVYIAQFIFSDLSIHTKQIIKQ